MKKWHVPSIVAILLILPMYLSGCSSKDGEGEATSIYSGLSAICNDLDYSVLEEELGPEEESETVVGQDGEVIDSSNGQYLWCLERRFLHDDTSTAGTITSRISTNESGSYGIDLSEEEASEEGQWRDFATVYPGLAAPGQETSGDAESMGETLLDSGEADFDSWDRVMFAHYSAGDAGQTWDPEGTGAVVFAWFERENLRVEFRLGVDADLYSTAPQTESLLDYLSEIADSVKDHLEFGPVEGTAAVRVNEAGDQ